MKPVVCTHKHPMMQYSQLASRQVFAESTLFPGQNDNAKLDAPVVLQHGAESAPRGEQALLLCYTRYPAAALLDSS